MSEEPNYHGIERTHVDRAISEILNTGFPDKNESKRWDLVVSASERLPPKQVLGRAAELAKRSDKIKHKGGGWPTNDILEFLGYTIVDKLNKPLGNRPKSILNLAQLKDLARRKGKRNPKRSSATIDQYERQKAVVDYVKAAANGTCDLCSQDAPFLIKNVPHLECHHVTWLAKGGADTIDNAVALCPNCHRRMHLLNDADDVRELKGKILARDRN